LKHSSWEDDEGERPLGSLEFLQAIYRNQRVTLPVRMRAAIEALPFESPKLSATATLTRVDFGTLLDAAIARSDRARLIEHRAEEDQQ
jgi:hypothetical protein